MKKYEGTAAMKKQSSVRVQQHQVFFAAFPDHSLQAADMLHRCFSLHNSAKKQEAELLSLLKTVLKNTFCSLQQHQGVISQCVDSKADHRLRFVHAAPQSSS